MSTETELRHNLRDVADNRAVLCAESVQTWPAGCPVGFSPFVPSVVTMDIKTPIIVMVCQDEAEVWRVDSVRRAVLFFLSHQPSVTNKLFMLDQSINH